MVPSLAMKLMEPGAWSSLLGGIQRDTITRAAQLEVEGVPLVAHTVAVHVVAGGEAPLRYRFQRLATNELRGLPFWSWRMAASVVALPNLRKISSTRSSARCAADIRARLSPSSKSG